MSKREPVQLTVFFLLFWFAVLLFSMTIHEMGHALTVAFVGGWRNSTAFFGGAAYHEPSFLLAMVDQVQASGLTPSEWGMEQNFQLMGDLARQVIPFRFGVIGGWLGQLAAVLIVYLIFRSHTFQVGGSSFSRLFWGCFMFFNLAWIGGLWFLDGLWAPNSSDSVVLVNIILERNPLALGALWLIGVALVGLSLFLANRYGGGGVFSAWFERGRRATISTAMGWLGGGDSAAGQAAFASQMGCDCCRLDCNSPDDNWANLAPGTMGSPGRASRTSASVCLVRVSCCAGIGPVWIGDQVGIHHPGRPGLDADPSYSGLLLRTG